MKKNEFSIVFFSLIFFVTYISTFSCLQFIVVIISLKNVKKKKKETSKKLLNLLDEAYSKFIIIKCNKQRSCKYSRCTEKNIFLYFGDRYNVEYITNTTHLFYATFWAKCLSILCKFVYYFYTIECCSIYCRNCIKYRITGEENFCQIIVLERDLSLENLIYF